MEVKKESTVLEGHKTDTGNLASLVLNPAQQTLTRPGCLPQPTELKPQHPPCSSAGLSPCKAHSSYLGLHASTCAQPSLYFIT